MTTLYEKYGGFATIHKVVHEFYDRIGATPELDRYFRDVDMAKLVDHQTKFLCVALGGPIRYEGRTLAKAHQRLNISAEHFDLVAEILEDTLVDCGVEEDDVAAILGVVGDTRADIVASAA